MGFCLPTNSRASAKKSSSARLFVVRWHAQNKCPVYRAVGSCSNFASEARPYPNKNCSYCLFSQQVRATGIPISAGSKGHRLPLLSLCKLLQIETRRIPHSRPSPNLRQRRDPLVDSRLEVSRFPLVGKAPYGRESSRLSFDSTILQLQEVAPNSLGGMQPELPILNFLKPLHLSTRTRTQ